VGSGVRSVGGALASARRNLTPHMGLIESPHTGSRFRKEAFVDALGRNPVCAATALTSLAAAVGAKGYVTGEDFYDIQRCQIGLEIDGT
jgi:hypothetical protein